MRIRNVALLSIGQALGNSGLSLVVLLGGIIGARLAPTPTLATLPFSCQVLGVALATVPAALVMRRYGRRKGIVGASLLGAWAALLASYAILERSFGLFCIGTFLTGVNGAFIQQYRFAASESVASRHASRAVSFVLVGGIVAGVLGPALATRTRELVPEGIYSASFMGLCALYLLAALALAFLREIGLPQEIGHLPERPLRQIMLQPHYLVALLAGAAAYGVMSLTMTATPLYLTQLGSIPLEQVAWIVQSHMIAMFLPSLFTGFIIERLGVLRVMLGGVVILGFCVLLGVFSQHALHYWGTLVLLGTGWNFLYVGATVLLTRSYRPTERFKAQAANELIIFTVQAIGSLSSGAILFSLGWVALNLVALPLLALTIGALLFVWRRYDRRLADQDVLGGMLGVRSP